jgi:hypothetical protein
MGACEGTFPPRIPRKQRCPSALQTMNCTPADYRLQKTWGKQPTGTEQGSPHCSVWNSHKSQARICKWFAEQAMLPNNSVVFHLIMVQRNGEKRSWITSGSHTSISIHWHQFGVLEADDYRQNNRLRFGDKLIFVNYIYMNKKEFKKLYTNCIKEMWSSND